MAFTGQAVDYSPLMQGISNFGSQLAGAYRTGVMSKYEAQQQQLMFDQQAARQQVGYDHADRMQQQSWMRQDAEQAQRWGREDSKDLASKSERADFAEGAWQQMAQQAPDLITPELTEKFKSSGLGAKEGMLNAAQASYKKWLEAHQDQDTGGPLSAVPIPNEKGEITGHAIMNGEGKVYGWKPAAPPAMAPPEGMVPKRATVGGVTYEAPSGPPSSARSPKVETINGTPMVWDNAKQMFVPAPVAGQGGAPAPSRTAASYYQ